MIASRDGQTGTVKVLVEAGADKEAKTNVRDEKWEDHTLFNGGSFMIARQSFMCYMCAQEWCSCLLFFNQGHLENKHSCLSCLYLCIYIYSFTTLCATYLFPVNFSMAAYFVFLYIIYPRCFYWLSLLWCASLSYDCEVESHSAHWGRAQRSLWYCAGPGAGWCWQGREGRCKS